MKECFVNKGTNIVRAVLLILTISSCSGSDHILEERLGLLKIDETYDVYLVKPRQNSDSQINGQFIYGKHEKSCFESFENEWDISSSDKEVYLHIKNHSFFVVLSFYEGRPKYIWTMKYKEINDVLQYESNIFRLTCNTDKMAEIAIL